MEIRERFLLAVKYHTCCDGERLSILINMPDATNKSDLPQSSNAVFPPEGATSLHTLELRDCALEYTAIAEWTTLRKVHKAVAHIFHTAYFLQKTDSVSRPITFVFNGGPGAASAYLHMGAVGPRRVTFGPQGTLPSPPTKIVDNLETWLTFTDLVFIDPIGTGFSRALQDEKPDKGNEDKGKKSDEPVEKDEFWEIERDLDSLGEFIRHFLSMHHRWTSPIFIAGESYGGFRVAKMIRKLQETHGVGLCGAMLISPVIEFESLFSTDYNLTHWIELFPSLVATAFEHGRMRNPPQDGTIESVVEMAESFAQNQIARFMASGDALSVDERTTILAQMSDLAGLSPEVVNRADGRLTTELFCRELLRDERRFCGRYDASITTPDPFPDRDNYEGPDPTLMSLDRLYTAAINDHLRAKLGVTTDLDYRLLSYDVNRSWKDASEGHVFRRIVGAMDDMRYGMSLNEHTKVFISHGYFDLVTPYFSSGRLTQLMRLTPEQRQNLTCENYKGGHMFYSWDESRIAFTEATRAFMESAVPSAES